MIKYSAEVGPFTVENAGRTGIIISCTSIKIPIEIEQVNNALDILAAAYDDKINRLLDSGLLAKDFLFEGYVIRVNSHKSVHFMTGNCFSIEVGSYLKIIEIGSYLKDLIEAITTIRKRLQRYEIVPFLID